MGVTVPEMEEMARQKRAEATRFLSDALGLPPDITSGSVERAVECIVSSALLEVAAVQKRASGRNQEPGT